MGIITSIWLVATSVAPGYQTKSTAIRSARLSVLMNCPSSTSALHAAHTHL